ncbi:MAG: hypothetical protein D6702_11535 [Planctomycetota bacterium]|nr:MAG: hypothetical protein D6702_11535 [Planctomycetota bacterium]
MSWIVLALVLAGPAPLAAAPAVPVPSLRRLAQEPPPEQPTEEPKAEAEDGNGKEGTSPYLAVVGGEVHTVTDGVLPAATVLCKGDRILKVGAGVRVPEGARVIDATGMKVYPGLIAVRSSGIVSGRGESVRDEYDPFALNVDLGLAGGLTAVETGGAVAKLLRHSVEGALIGKPDWVTVSYSPSSPRARREWRARLEGARDFLRRQRSYEAAKAAGEEDISPPDPKSVNQQALRLLQRQATARFNADSAKDLLAVCELLEDFPMNAVIFGGREAWTLADRLGRTGARLVITPRAKRRPDPELSRPNGWSIENARILWEHGVEFAIVPGQAYITTGGIAGRDLLTLPMEVAFAIRGGLPEEAALRSITIDAARILGVEDRIGSIEPGKDADLIVCDGDLFDYRTFVQWAVVAGDIAYDKQMAPYFAHIRPRPEPSAGEVIDAVIEGIRDQQDEAAEDGGDGGSNRAGDGS